MGGRDGWRTEGMEQWMAGWRDGGLELVDGGMEGQKGWMNNMVSSLINIQQLGIHIKIPGLRSFYNKLFLGL